MTPGRQAAIGLGLAAAIIAGWTALHLRGVFLHDWGPGDWWRAPLLIAVQTWLAVGLFIVAHDAIHGSLAPGRPRLNAAIGQVAVALYAGFALGKLAHAHGRHHAHPGQAEDPDFWPEAPRSFGAWFTGFFRRYFGWREFAGVTLVLLLYLSLGADLWNLLAFWALPALLSALQLFVFGTWLPHRHEDQAFADEHRARSLDYPWVLSLLACFHFGRHREHHLHPDVPWWRLPEVRIDGAR
jgi:beta-carotene ketolase (CrtW type)